MEKLLVLILCLLLMLASCVQSEPDTSAPETSSVSSEAVSSEAFSSEDASSEDASSEDASSEEESEAPQGDKVDRTGKRVLISEGAKYSTPGNPHGQYYDDGKMLTDGTMIYEFAGFGNAVNEFVIDLGSVRNDIADFDIIMMGDNWGIVLGDTAEYYVSSDGKSFAYVGKTDGDGVKKESADAWNVYNYPFESENLISGRYVKIKVSGTNTSPNYAWVCELCVWAYEKEEKNEVKHEFTGTESFSNLTFDRGDGKMGDVDGPAYCVYSKKGYNKSSMIVDLGSIDLNISSTDAGRHINAYIFMGVDVYNDGGYWCNCIDMGLLYSGSATGWHIFHNIYDMGSSDKASWYESGVSLDGSHVYEITLSSAEKDGYCSITVFDLTVNKLADSYEAPIAGAKKDGSNTSQLMNFAVDYPPDMWYSADGKTKYDTWDSADWIEVTLYNTNKGMHMNNIAVWDCTLYDVNGEYEWSTDRTANRGIWPDIGKGIDYACTKITKADENKSFILDLTLER